MQIVLIAAGRSSRFWPYSETRHKSEFFIGNKTILEHCIDLVPKGTEIIVVLNPKSSAANSLSERKNVTVVFQKEPKGAYDAIMTAEPLLKGEFMVALPQHLEIKEVLDKLKTVPSPAIVVRKYRTFDEERRGIARIESGKVKKIVEKKFFEGANASLNGIYKFEKDFILRAKKTKGKDEYVLEDILQQYASERKLSAIYHEEETPSLKYAYDLLAFKDALHAKLPKGREEAVVGKNVCIEDSVIIGKNVRIGNNVSLKGKCIIGNNVFIGDNALVRDSVLSDGASIGFGTELAKSVVSKNSNFHSGYIGDSVIGEDCSFGANFVTANRRIDRNNIKIKLEEKEIDSGRSFLGVMAGDGVKAGINVSSMPGTIVGSGCTIGANTEVRGFVPSNKLIYAESKNVVKEMNKRV